jgi:hypothetical protein
MESDSQNNIVFCGSVTIPSAGKSIYKYDTDFNQIWSFGTSSPAGNANFNRINFTTSGDIVASSFNGTVVKLNSSGTCLMSKYYTYTYGNIYSSCVDSNNNIWVGVQGGMSNLYKYDSGGNLLSSYFIGPGSPSASAVDIVYDLVADTSGYIYVSSNAYLYKVSGTGSIVWSQNPGANGSPYTKSLVYKNGYIYFLTNSIPRFKVYDTSGTLSLSFDVERTTINVQPI